MQTLLETFYLVWISQFCAGLLIVGLDSAFKTPLEKLRQHTSVFKTILAAMILCAFAGWALVATWIISKVLYLVIRFGLFLMIKYVRLQIWRLERSKKHHDLLLARAAANKAL